MNSKLLNLATIESFETELESEMGVQPEIASLDSLTTKHQPTEDFRVLVSNLRTIEETMTAKAKTVSQKTQLLITWEKLKGLLMAMTDRLEKDIERARQIEQQLAEAKEKARMLQMRSGYYN